MKNQGKHDLKTIAWLALVVASSSTLTHAGIYKWTDKQGKVHYADRPLSDKATNQRMLNNNGTAKPEPTKPTAAEAKAKYEAEQAAIKKQNCDNLKATMHLLDSTDPVIRFNAKGDKETLTDEARAVEKTKTKASMAENCPK